MTVTALDPTTALLLIDLQKGTLGHDLAHPAGGVLERSLALAAAFTRLDLPIVVVRAAGVPAGRTEYSAGRPIRFPDEFAQLVAEVADLPAAIQITKTSWGAFGPGVLHEELTRLGVTQVVLAGVATSFGVESTAREAYDLGYHVVIALDAITDPRIASHQHSTTTVFPALAQLGTSAEIIALLDDPESPSPQS
ncbi:MAG: isochorismatase family protein [Gordonia sp. (in: high G+C Gram-positive bacteria)]